MRAWKVSAKEKRALLKRLPHGEELYISCGQGCDRSDVGICVFKQGGCVFCGAPEYMEGEKAVYTKW